MHSPLLATLRHQQLELLSDLDRVRRLLDTGTAQVFMELRHFRIVLMDHLALEDATLFPALNRATRVRPDLAKLLGGHLRELAALQSAAYGFFDRCAREEGLDDQLKREFTHLARAIRLRMDRGEMLLALAFQSLRQDEDTLH